MIMRQIYVCVLLLRCITVINSQQHVIIPSDKLHSVDIEPLIIDIRIPDIDTCQQIKSDDCKNLIDQMFKCQQIIFNDPGFSYQQYKGNMNVHREILAKYQSICEDVHSDYLVNKLFDFKKD